MEISIQIFGDGLPIPGLVGRHSSGGVTLDTTVLPIGAIVGIAVVGSAILFGILTMTIMHYLRSRYKLKNGSRDLDLVNNNEEDIFDALRSTRPSKRGLFPKITYKASNVGSESLLKEGTESPFCGPPLYKSKLIPPAYAIDIAGLRDSWPLVGWVESASTVPLFANKHPVIISGNPDKRTSYSAFPLSMDTGLSWPQTVLSRSSSFSQGLDGRSIQWSGHSAKSSITSLKRPSSTRKSVSDNQLTSILRSTSQRLKEGQRRPLSRSLSVMSRVSGAPPTVQPPSPPGDQRGESREALIDTDDVSLIDSVRSSVLNSVSQTPSPQKMTLHTSNKIGKDGKKEASPATSGISEPDSLCLSKTPDLFIPAALTSPSKRGARSDQKYEMTISSKDGPSAKVHRYDSHCIPAGGGTGMAYDVHSPHQIDSVIDPFVDLTAKRAPKSKSVQGPRPMIKRQVTVEQSPKLKGRETLPSPLRVVSGNQNSPTKSTPASIDLSEATQENPFQWSPHYSSSLALSTSQKPMGIKPKGHRRRRTVRLSHISRPVSVAVVLEEPENVSWPSRMDGSLGTQKSHLITPAEPTASIAPNYSKIPSIRPPAIAIFEPFAAAPSAGALADSKRPSDGSYSATVSFYDYYSSGGALPSDHPGIHGQSQSPTPSTKKSRRRGCNFSIDDTHTRDVTFLEATTSSLQPDGLLPPPPPHCSQTLKFPKIQLLSQLLYQASMGQSPNPILRSTALSRQVFPYSGE